VKAHNFYPHNTMLVWYMLWPRVCPWVHLYIHLCISNTSYVTVTKHSIAQTVTYNVIFFWRKNILEKFIWGHFQQDARCMWGSKNFRHSTYDLLYLKNSTSSLEYWHFGWHWLDVTSPSYPFLLFCIFFCISWTDEAKVLTFCTQAITNVSL